MGLELVRKITESQLKKDLPDLRPGMTVNVGVKIKEGDKTRVQAFEGMVINFIYLLRYELTYQNVFLSSISEIF